jgi:hypothetical protein
VATPRTSQAHQKRVQQIAAEAAEKIAADSPVEEEVVVVVEELPPGASTSTRRRGARSTTDEVESSLVASVAHGQQLMADGIASWIAMTTAPFEARTQGTDAMSALVDPRHLMRETFRLAEELLASQKEFTLKVVEAMTAARAA